MFVFDIVYELFSFDLTRKEGISLGNMHCMEGIFSRFMPCIGFPQNGIGISGKPVWRAPNGAPGSMPVCLHYPPVVCLGIVAGHGLAGYRPVVERGVVHSLYLGLQVGGVAALEGHA